MYSEMEIVVPEDYEIKYPEKQWLAARLRKALGRMQQSELMKLLEENGYPIAQQRLSHLMQGRNYPDPETFRELVRALGVSADWVLGLTEQDLPVSDLDEMIARGKEDSYIESLMRQLADDEQVQVERFAEFLLSQKKTEKQDREVSEWIAATEVLLRRHGKEGEDSFVEGLLSARPDLATALGIPAKKKTV